MKRQEGFTLIEVVVSLAVFMIVIVFVVGAMGVYARVNAAANNKTKVQQIAVNTTEEIVYVTKTSSTDKLKLIDSLNTSKQFGVFLIDGTVYKAAKDGITTTLTFTKEDKVLVIRVELNSGESFETIEWLNYAKP